MSSEILFGQSYIQFSQGKQIGPTSYTSQEILHQPVDRINQIIKIESEILSTFKSGLTFQYESFDFKYNTFKQLIQEFRIKSDQDQTQMLEMFGVNNQANLKPSKHKLAKAAQAILEKNESKFQDEPVAENSGSYDRGIVMEKPMMRQRKPKVQNQVKFSEDNVRQEQNRQTIEKREKKAVKQTESDAHSEQQNSEKGEKIKDGKRRTGMNFVIEQRGPNKYEISRKRLEEVIKNKGKITNHYNRIGEILLHPYSTLQMLLDYNQSSDYPLVRVKRNEFVGSENESD